MHSNLIFAYCPPAFLGLYICSLLKCRFLNFDFVLVATIFCHFVKVIDVKSKETRKTYMVDNSVYECDVWDMCSDVLLIAVLLIHRR